MLRSRTCCNNPRKFKSFQQLNAGDPEAEVAGIVLHLVKMLEHSRRRPQDPLLPRGLGLNVNIPAFARGSAGQLKFRLSRIGFSAWVTPVFVDDLSQDSTARSFGISAPALPGVSLIVTESAPRGRAIPVDTNPASEQNVVNAGQIAVSVIKGEHQAEDAASAVLGRRITRLLNARTRVPTAARP